jgi:L-aminopeptidase/D-esterase-like protein
MEKIDLEGTRDVVGAVEAVVPATEEAVVNALVANEEMVGYRGRRTPSLPRDRVVALSVRPGSPLERRVDSR